MEIKLFEGVEVRFVVEGDSFWVVGKDVLRALGYSEAGSMASLFANVPEEWKGSKPIATPGGTQQMLCLSEQGLYFFLGRSDKPKALPYQKWIAGDVVPSIRKTGSYSVIEKPQEVPPTALEKFQIWQAVLATAYEGNQLTLALDKCAVRLTGESALRTAEVELIAPQQQQLYTPTQIGKNVHPVLSSRKVNRVLEAMGWQIRIDDKWEACGDNAEKHAVYVDTNKARSNGTPVRQLKWTSDTIFFVQDFLNEHSDFLA